MHCVFVTGTDTDVGKTWIAAALLRQLHSDGQRLGTYKPACSGAEFDDVGRPQWRDIDSLAEAADFTGDRNLICPQRFLAPLAPNVAARLEGRSVDDQLLGDGLRLWEGQADVVIVEGAGGLLSPLSDHSTNADLAVRLRLPVVIVAANRLGVLNHTALTIEAARQRGLEVVALVLNEVTAQTNASGSDLSAEHNGTELIRLLGGVPLFACGYGSSGVVAVNDTAKRFESLAQISKHQ